MSAHRRLRRRLGRSCRRLEKLLYAAGVLSTNRLCLPDFLGIGAMKSGTTWLYENLRRHPELYLPPEKELYYFSLRYENRSLRWYSSMFRAGRRLLKGDITPGYGIIPADRIRFVGKIMPAVKLIFLMRNPMERTWSEAYMNLVAKPGRALEDVTDEEFLAYFRSEQCARRSDYAAILEAWLSVFPRDQLLIEYLDDIRQRPKDVLSSVFDFLGVSAAVDWSYLPAARVVVPHYEANRMVYGGDLPSSYEPTSTFLPDRFREPLERMHARQMERLQRLYGAPVEQWRRSSERQRVVEPSRC